MQEWGESGEIDEDAGRDVKREEEADGFDGESRSLGRGKRREN